MIHLIENLVVWTVLSFMVFGLFWFCKEFLRSDRIYFYRK